MGERGVVGRGQRTRRGRRRSCARMGRTSSEGFDSSVVASLSSGFGFFLRRAGVGASEAVLMVPLVAAVPFFGFVLLESLISDGILFAGAF